ncbi:hypothetical protein ACFV6F_01995 [Kitasatospora phosalacinea]|uniref:hypothetical protein n=1 Tax=Kitasatospora phosalacinea TaxID=2065 RepID=UPI00364EAE3E
MSRPLPSPTPIRCSHCGHTGLDQGFIEDDGQSSQGDARWIPGAVEHGPLGGARRFGRPRLQIDAFRCPACGHLELFARTRLS